MKNKKITINFTIEPELKKDFINFSNKLGINRSKMISNFIRDWINKSVNDLNDDKG